MPGRKKSKTSRVSVSRPIHINKYFVDFGTHGAVAPVYARNKTEALKMARKKVSIRRVKSHVAGWRSIRYK